MTVKPEILFLTHRIPYPPDKGDKIRSWRLLKHLIGRFDVHLACFVDDPADFAHREYLAALCRSAAFIPLQPFKAKARSALGFFSGEPLSVVYFRSAAMRRAVGAARARPLAAEIAFSSTMAQYLEPAIEGRPRIVDFCDSDAEKWRQYAENANGPMARIYVREGALLAQAESKIANDVDASFAVTAEEAALFNRRSEIRRNVGWWSNGVDADYFSPTAPHREKVAETDVVFTGAMNYRANVEAVHDFLDLTWPQIRKAVPDARFAVVGARPVKSLRDRDGREGVIVTGRVEDVRPWLQGAKVVVAPMRVARGIQNKVLEAMAMARPVVATMAAATGVDAKAGEAIAIADGSDAMARTVIRLLHEDSARAQMGLAARAAVLERYQWARRLEPFDAALNELVGGYSSSESLLPSSVGSSAALA